jgi:hypothetical protein
LFVCLLCVFVCTPSFLAGCPPAFLLCCCVCGSLFCLRSLRGRSGLSLRSVLVVVVLASSLRRGFRRLFLWGFPMSSLSFVRASAFVSCGVPAFFAVRPGLAPVPSSSFVPLLGGAAVSLLSVSGFRSRSGVPGLRVSWSCAVSGCSGSLVALSSGFPGGSGSPAAGEFLAAVRAAVASGSPVFLAGAPGARGSVCPGFFCALSDSPFGASAPSAPADPLASF